VTALLIGCAVVAVVAAGLALTVYVVACRVLGDPGREGRLQAAVDGAYAAAHELMDEPHVALIVVLERLEGVVTPEEPRDVYLEAVDAGGGERPDWGEGRGRRWLRAQR
jgi:hypothetical protein